MSTVDKIIAKYERIAAHDFHKPLEKEESFTRVIAGKRFRNPKTGRMVTFSSLPPEEQKKIRAQHSRHFKPDSGPDAHPNSAHINALKKFGEWHKRKQPKTGGELPMPPKKRKPTHVLFRNR